MRNGIDNQSRQAMHYCGWFYYLALGARFWSNLNPASEYIGALNSDRLYANSSDGKKTPKERDRVILELVGRTLKLTSIDEEGYVENYDTFEDVIDRSEALVLACNFRTSKVAITIDKFSFIRHRQY
jgi:hypothetical protein